MLILWFRFMKIFFQAPEKDKYKSLARRLKEERNQYKDMVEEKKKEQDELKIEIEKMTEIIGDLRENCGKLQEELLQVRLDSPRRMSEKSVQTHVTQCGRKTRLALLTGAIFMLLLVFMYLC